MKKSILATILAGVMGLMLLTGCANTPATTPTPDGAAPTPAAGEGTQADEVYDAAFNYFKNFPSDKNVIAPADLFTFTDDMLVLDIRRPDDYKAGHVKGAVNLSFFDMSISASLESLPTDKPVMVYCYTGQTASQVTALLNMAGRTAKNVQSGFAGISAVEGYETYIETTENALSTEKSEVSQAMKTTIADYFAAKMRMDDTLFANFNISPENVKKIVDEKNDEYYILSVRQAEDYAKGHIAGAANIPYGQGMQDELVKLPKDKEIIVYCYSGQTSSQTTAVLRLMGYKAYSMSGGMGKEGGAGWLGAGYEVEAS